MERAVKIEPRHSRALRRSSVELAALDRKHSPAAKLEELLGEIKNAYAVARLQLSAWRRGDVPEGAVVAAFEQLATMMERLPE